MKSANILFVLMFLLHSCQFHNKPETDEPGGDVLYSISLHKAFEEGCQPASLSEIGGNIAYIPFEVNANSMFKRIGMITITDSSIFIGELEFDISGKYVRHIGQRGKGPEDYNFFSSFMVHDTLRYVLSFPPKLLIYNADGKFLRSIIQSFEFEQMLMMGKEKIVFRFPHKGGKERLLITDLNLNPLHTFRSYVKRGQYGPPLGFGVLEMYPFQGSIHYMEKDVDTLFTVTADSLIPYALFDLGKRKLPADLGGLTDLGEFYARHAGKVWISRIFEDTKHFYMRFDYFTEQSSFVYGLYSKQTGDVKIINESVFQNDIDGGLPFFPKYVYNDSVLVDWVDAYDLREKVLNADTTEMHNLYGQKFDDLLKLAKSLKDDSGFVLVLLKP